MFRFDASCLFSRKGDFKTEFQIVFLVSILLQFFSEFFCNKYLVDPLLRLPFVVLV